MVFDLSGPPEPAPRFILHHSASSPAGTTVRPEVYNWQTSTWRPLPAQAEAPAPPKAATHAAASVGPDEINQGLVRIRGPLLQAFLTP